MTSFVNNDGFPLLTPSLAVATLLFLAFYLHQLLFTSSMENDDTSDLIPHDVDGLSIGAVISWLVKLAKERLDSLHLLMLPSVLFGVTYRAHQFAQEGFHDMFSISMNLFVPSESTQMEEVPQYVFAVRTLKEVPLKEMFFEDGPVTALKTAAEKSAAAFMHTGQASRYESKEMNLAVGDELKEPPSTHKFCFVDLIHVPDSYQTLARLREHCVSKLSDLFGVFQALSAMRAGPIASRRFCWAVTYDAALPVEKSYRQSVVTRGMSEGWRTVSQSTKTLFGIHASVDDNSCRLGSSTYAENGDKGNYQLQHSASNKFRLILIELDCLRRANLKTPDEIPFEMEGQYYEKRWATIIAMRRLFDLDSGQPRHRSTTLCGSVTFSAPYTMAPFTMAPMENAVSQQRWLYAPWDSWGAEDTSSEKASSGLDMHMPDRRRKV